MKPAPSMPAPASRRHALWLLLAYPVLAVAGALTHRPIFPLLALVALATALMLPRLQSRRPLPWLAWLLLLAGVWLLSRHGLADLLLEAVPILINVVLACWFGRSLAGGEPLVARFVVAIEGVERLREPGVARYARQVTWFWTVLLATQALLLTGLLLFAADGGLLLRLGVTPPWLVPGRWVSAWLHVGCYLLLGAAFGLEYAWRRWRLRHLSHPGLHDMLLKLALRWPQLLHGNGGMPS
ncbi:xanthomonadin biosynthesis protein [Rhodanobacter lindaniclasticus]